MMSLRVVLLFRIGPAARLRRAVRITQRANLAWGCVPRDACFVPCRRFLQQNNKAHSRLDCKYQMLCPWNCLDAQDIPSQYVVHGFYGIYRLCSTFRCVKQSMEPITYRRIAWCRFRFGGSRAACCRSVSSIRFSDSQSGWQLSGAKYKAPYITLLNTTYLLIFII